MNRQNKNGGKRTPSVSQKYSTTSAKESVKRGKKEANPSNSPRSSSNDKGGKKVAKPQKEKNRFFEAEKQAKQAARKSEKQVVDKTSYRPRSGSPTLAKKYAKSRITEPLPDLNKEEMRLNKFLSNAGIASRREADILIAVGSVSVNGKVITEMGFKVKPTDTIQYGGVTIHVEKKQYVLLNKPKDFITTMDDPMGRKTVMALVRNACKERIYPVGRLDRNTTGVLLFTNDGDLAKRLTHPKHQIKKIYHVTLTKPVSYEDIEKLRKGIHLEDGFIKCDQAEYVKNGKSNEVGVEIHSGRNRIVRRIFEKLEYVVDKLDRVEFAGLTKKDLPRGTFRHLTEKEVSYLKMIS